MKKAAVSGAALLTVVVGVLALVRAFAGDQGAFEQDANRQGATVPASPAAAEPAEHRDQGFLYGRVVGADGAQYVGRLRFGGDEEAFWGNYFNGFKDQNPWATHAPLEQLTQKRQPLRVLGFEISLGDRQADLGRPLMARFGDIVRIEARGRDLQVTFKSGTVFHLDRYAADDFADGLRVWDVGRGVVNLDEWQIRSIEFLPTPRLEATPDRLHGAVRTAHGDFTGFIQWDREQCVGPDQLAGRTADGDVSLRFDTIRAIARRSRDSALVTLRDGRELVLSSTREAGNGHRGIYVDDRRYGRVLVSWDAFERIDFSSGGSSPAISGLAASGPGYSDFPSGRPLTGSVTTLAGRRVAGRLVFDLDESETTETLDAPAHGVDYTIPFGLIAAIAPVTRDERDAPRGAQRARVMLHDGEALQLDRAGDLGDGNAGLLIFVNGRERPEYVRWSDVEHIDFARPL